jgi:TetR/AcrR family transcriptional repressor of uid operon
MNVNEEKPGGLETRRRILEAAEECFALYGYDSTGVAEICKTAEVSKGALYHHFPSKQAIFVEMFETWMGGFAEQMQRIPEQVDSVPDALQRMAKMTGLVFQRAAGQLPLFIEFLTKASRDPDTWKVTIAPYKFFRDFFTDLIRRGVQEGSLRQVDPGLTARILVSFGAGLVMQGVFDPGGGRWTEVGVQGIQTILQGINKET